MEVALMVGVWYLCGVLGCVAGTASELRDGKNFTAGDLVGCTLAALGGMLTLVIGVGVYLSSISKSGKVLIKGKRK